MTEQTTIDTAGALPVGELAEIALADEQQTEQPRDIEAEARKHGWRPKEEFKGDPARWTDAETFVKRADEVMLNDVPVGPDSGLGAASVVSLGNEHIADINALSSRAADLTGHAHMVGVALQCGRIVGVGGTVLVAFEV